MVVVVLVEWRLKPLVVRPVTYTIATLLPWSSSECSTGLNLAHTTLPSCHLAPTLPIDDNDNDNNNRTQEPKASKVLVPPSPAGAQPPRALP